MEQPLRDLVPIADLPDDKTGEDAYARRLRLSQPAQNFPPPPPQEPEDVHADSSRPPPPPAEAQPGIVVSRAPVRYNLPDAPSELPASEAELEKALEEEAEDEDGQEPQNSEAPRSLRPGQKGFAERLMSKYGWTKGSGLGADGSGIINPLRVQVEKRRKKPDSEGGGFADPKGIGKIIGGKKKAPDNDTEGGKFGAMSEVIVLHGMVDGMDLDEEVEDSGDGGLMQEIGDECSEKVNEVPTFYHKLYISYRHFYSTAALRGFTLTATVRRPEYSSNSQVSSPPCA
jgi:splicing factor 45